MVKIGKYGSLSETAAQFAAPREGGTFNCHDQMILALFLELLRKVAKEGSLLIQMWIALGNSLLAHEFFSHPDCLTILEVTRWYPACCKCSQRSLWRYARELRDAQRRRLSYECTHPGDALINRQEKPTVCA